MISLKTKILDFLRSNCDKKSPILRYIQKIDSFDLESLLEKLADSDKIFFFYSKPEENYSFIGIDSLSSSKCAPLLNGIRKGQSSGSTIIESNGEKSDSVSIPLFVGGMKFTHDTKELLWKDFPDELWFVPKIILISCNGSYYFVFCTSPNDYDLSTLDFLNSIIGLPTEQVKKELSKKSVFNSETQVEWAEKVNAYLAEIKSGRIEKAVLARRVSIELNDKFNLTTAVTELQKKYISCTTFAYRSNRSLFWGSTPERLFTHRNGILKTEAVAGSIGRGVTESDDFTKENILLSDPKELREHKNVIDYISEKLETFTYDLQCDEIPKIKKLKNIQHIQTRVCAKLKNEINILDVVKVLHPTSAVCGFPQTEAFKLINEIENFDRGMYAGVIGWFDENQNGEFDVAIRSALLVENKIYAYAGCGIVEGSNPDAEYNETELKLNPILSLLNNEDIPQS